MKVLLKTRRVLLLMLVVLASLLGLVGEYPGVAHAASTVNVTSCPDEMTLLADIASAGPGGTVRFSINSSCMIPLTIAMGGTLVIGQDLTLDNQGQRVILDGGGTVQVIQVNSGVSFVLNALTIANGSAVRGGGLHNLGGIVSITNSTFANNSATEAGGGLLSDGSIVSITNSTFANNSGTGLGGGGIVNASGTMSISNSTVANNSGIGLLGAGGLGSDGGLTVRNSIVANNTSSKPGTANCDALGGIIDGGYNLSNDTSCGFTDPTSRQGPSINPQLDPAGLRDNGGPTQTIALLPSSPAIDFIPAPSKCTLHSDQRGFPRPDNSGESTCDIGAYEFQDPPTTTTVINGTTTDTDTLGGTLSKIVRR